MERRRALRTAPPGHRRIDDCLSVSQRGRPGKDGASPSSDLVSSVGWPSSPRPSSPSLPPAVREKREKYDKRWASGALSLRSGGGVGREREGGESAGQPRRGG